MKQINTSSCESDTERFGLRLAEYAEKNKIKFIALYGDLGVGKTAFVRGFVSYFMPCAAVMSPTYTIVNIYGNIYHFDMYRITDEDDLYSTGFYDYDDGDNIIITEWSENIEFALPKKYLKVTLEKTFKTLDEREIKAETIG